MPIHIGFFRDFKLSDTLLIEGDSNGLRQLADVFRHLAEGGGSTAIHELPFVAAHHGIRVVASTVDHDCGASKNGLDVSWERSRSGWQETADKLGALETATAAHQYLDAGEEPGTTIQLERQLQPAVRRAGRNVGGSQHTIYTSDAEQW